MGGCLSHNASFTISNCVRVIHLDGWIEDYDIPVSVRQVTGSSTKYLVFTAPQLLSTGFKPLKPDTLLELGLLYFMVPSSIFQAAVYPSDFASKVQKLTAKAKSTKLQAKKSPVMSSSKICPELSSPAISASGVPAWNDLQRFYRKQSWKPMLDTIRERSFSRSEYDLHEAH